MTGAPVSRPGVLMVTGAYFPELSGGGLQCKAIVDTLRAEVQFAVLTTSTDPSLPDADTVDGTPVRRVLVDVSSRWSRSVAVWGVARAFLRVAGRLDIVHLHGFSRKAILLVLLAKLCRKRILLTLHTAGQDEPDNVKARGFLGAWAYRQIDLYIAVSAALFSSLIEAGVPASRTWRGSNGLDTRRFHPAAPGEPASLRRALGLPEDLLLVLFVGFFSADKGPHVLFEAWRRLAGGAGANTAVVFVGATRSRDDEVDESLAAGIRAAAGNEGLADRVVFVETTLRIEQDDRAADVFVFPTRREAFGMALVEAMASGLPCIASRLPGVTDDIVRDGESGLLVEPHDVAALAAALARVIGDRPLAEQMGASARRAVESRFDIERTARQTLEAYHYVLNPSATGMTVA